MSLSEQKKEGDLITVGDMKEIQEGIAKVNEVMEYSPVKEDSAVEETFVIELVKGCHFWNQRKCEIAMDSHTYHRIVQQFGEKDARNFLMPLTTRNGNFTFQAQSTSSISTGSEIDTHEYTKTSDGLELTQHYYPNITSEINYKIAHTVEGVVTTYGFRFTLLCGSKDHSEGWYFSRLGVEFANGYQFDQYIPGKIVYVHPTKTGNVLTPTETSDSFPCVIKTGPQCASWHYNTAYYVKSAEETKTAAMDAIKAEIANGDSGKESAVDAALKAYKTSPKSSKEEKLEDGWTAYTAKLGSTPTAQELEKLAEYLEASDATYNEEIVRFDNRQELLVAVARGNLEKHLGVQFEVDRTKSDDGSVSVRWEAKLTKGSLSKLISSVEHVTYSDVGFGVPDNLRTWLDVVASNISEEGGTGDFYHQEDLAAALLESIRAVGWWLQNAYDGDGKRIPCSLDAGHRGQLERVANNTYSLYQSTSLLLTVAKMVPGKKYEAFIDPALTTLSAKYDPFPKRKKDESYEEYQARVQEWESKKSELDSQFEENYATFTGKGPLIWDGNRFVPYSEPSDDNQKATKEIVTNYNRAREWVNKRLEEESASKAEFTFAPDAVMTVPKTSKPAFSVVDKAQTGGPGRTGQATASANFVANALQKEVFGGATSGFGIIVAPISEIKKSESNPWKTGFEEVSISFLEVSPKLPQQLWTRLLYCCQGRTSEISTRKLYGLFGGKDYVPERAVSYFSEYLAKINEALKYSRFIVYDGAINLKTGQFWCADTGEIYSHWFNINTNRKAKGPYRSEAECVNVLYTHRLDNALFGSSFGIEEYTDSNGKKLGYVLSQNRGMLFGAEDGDNGSTITGTGAPGQFTPPSGDSEQYHSEQYPTPVVSADSEVPVLKEAPFVPPTNEPIEEVTDPARSTEAEQVQVVYDPPKTETTTTVVEEAPATTGIVRLPLISYPLRDKETPPRINAPLNADGETIYDGAEYPTSTKKNKIAYSFLIAKCLGMIDLGKEPSYQIAHYSSQDDDRVPFWRDFEVGEDGSLVPSEEDEGGSNGEGNEGGSGNEGQGEGGNEQGGGGSGQGGDHTWDGDQTDQGSGGSLNAPAPLGAGFNSAIANKEVLGGALKAAKKTSGVFDVEIKRQFQVGSRMYFMGTYVPADRTQKKVVQYNLTEPERTEEDEEKSKSPVYVQQVCVKGQKYDKTAGSSDCSWGDESYPSFHPYVYTPKVDNEDEEQIQAMISNTTAGWIEYAYYDELEEYPSPETFKIKPPTIKDPAGKACTVTTKGMTWIFSGYPTELARQEGGEKTVYASLSPLMITPFWSGYSKKAQMGTAYVLAVTSTEATIAYLPAFNKSGNKTQTTYNQVWSFPFEVKGLPTPAFPMLTTMTYKAMRKDYVPALCPNLDQNEIITPGTIVEVSKRKVTLFTDKNDRKKTQDFEYYLVEPPSSYSTVTEGTPYTKVVKFKKHDPAPDELKNRIIEEGDLWIEDIEEVRSLPSCEVGGTEYYVGISLKPDGTPRIRQPYGIFNDCDNKAHLGLFIKRTPRGLSYPTSFRIDYVPYGYAVPSKTPACYYRISGEKCAANIISPQYVIKRVADTGTGYTLQLTGACYVPGSTLTVLG